MVSLGLVARLPQSNERQSAEVYLAPSALAPATAGRCRTKRSTMDFVISFSGKEKHSKLGVFPATVTCLLEDWRWTVVHKLFLRTLHGVLYFRCWHWHVELTGTNAGIARWPSPICTRLCQFLSSLTKVLSNLVLLNVSIRCTYEGCHWSPRSERVLSSSETQELDVQYLHKYLFWWRH